MFTGLNLILVIGLVAAGILLGYFLRFWIGLRRHESAEREILEKLKEAESRSKEIILEAKSKSSSILEEVQKDERERKQELRRLEERLLRREDDFSKEKAKLEEEARSLKSEAREIERREEKVQELESEGEKRLEAAAGMSVEKAKEALFENLKRRYSEEMLALTQKLEREKKEEIEKKGVEVMAAAMQRYSRTTVPDVTTTILELPNEELKGKIIGREGRNIRTFERLTGVEVVIDETPESLLLSSFDPIRREIAKFALEKLIEDGRIQPAKIEEKVEEARKEIDDRIKKVGEEAAYEVGILDLPKEITYLLGKLNYRTSYGQNVLTHSVEMAHIAGMIAAELGLDVSTTKKAALLHDIGKAIDHEVEGTHVELGRKILKKCGIDEKVIKGMEAHHEEYPFASPEAYIVAAADAISGARPGARRETLEKYLKRLEDIEKVVASFEGVKNAYAVSAGREVRVFVVPEKIDDFGALELAKQISAKIQSEVNYPGEIKVTVIREVKAVEYAR